MPFYCAFKSAYSIAKGLALMATLLVCASEALSLLQQAFITLFTLDRLSFFTPPAWGGWGSQVKTCDPRRRVVARLEQQNLKRA